MKTGLLLPHPTIEQRVEVCRSHFVKSMAWKNEIVGILEMRRHYTNYFKGLDHFKDYRTRLVTLENIDEIHGVLDEVLDRYSEVPTP